MPALTIGEEITTSKTAGADQAAKRVVALAANADLATATGTSAAADGQLAHDLKKIGKPVVDTAPPITIYESADGLSVQRTDAGGLDTAIPADAPAPPAKPVVDPNAPGTAV